MEKEDFLTGYCRVLDQSRMVTVVTEEGALREVDCCFGNCVFETSCTIGKAIQAILDGTE